MDDAQLISDYCTHASPEAFDVIVRRHANLVYAAALRQVRDPHRAEDVTQAVFIILAQKIGSIPNPQALPGWLIRTTRYAAANAAKYDKRRQFHEHKAAAMAPISTDEREGDSGDEIAPLLDRMLGHLRERDRSAIIMRYLQGMSMPAVASALGVSAQAAERRIGRALDKLRNLLVRHGVRTAGDALEMRLTNQALCTAPAALIATLGRVSMHPAGQAGAASIAKLTLKTMSITKFKFLALTGTAAMLCAGVCVTLALQPAHNAGASPSAPASQPTAIIAEAPPVKEPSLTIANDAYALSTALQGFEVDVEEAVKREHDSAGFIKAAAVDKNGTAYANYEIDAAPYAGKRVRFSIWAKSQDLENSAGLRLNVRDDAGRIFRYDEMSERPISGTSEWTKYERVTDVPAEATWLIVGTRLRGKGTLWYDGGLLEVVGSDVPLTDDRRWHLWSPYAALYAAELDPTVTRNGHATICISSTSPKSHGWAYYVQNDRMPDKYIGHKIRMTAWIKAESVTERSGLAVRVVGPGVITIADDGQRGKRPILGTVDWKQYQITCDVPETAQCIGTGFSLQGKGKVWIDDIKYDVVDSTGGL